MTGRATFGDFIQAAQRHLDPRPGVHGQPPARGNVGAVSQSLIRVITAMDRHLQDITAGLSDVPAHTRPELDAWSRASIEAREAFNTAARFLRRYHPGPRWPAAPATSPLAQRLDGVALSLTTGRDLLHTHFGVDPDGGRQHRSEWAMVITSPVATRALLAEIAMLSRRIARPCADLALARVPGERGNADARRALNAACQWLWVLNASVQAAHHREPVTAADRDLLHAIPVNVAPRRCLPDGTESVTTLCAGTISTAQRLRHLAWDAAQVPWSSGMSVTGMYEVAAANTATSHNCEVVLQVLAAGTARTGWRPVSEQLSAAADAARHAREGWLGTAHALDHINTDTRGQVSPAAAETRDLTLWTGRLAYADPQWTPASGPAQTPRSPASLAPRPGQVPAVMAAIQQVSKALTRLAETEHEQLRAAARAGRILVTTRSLPDGFDIPRPFARAPRERVERLLVHYRDAGQAARQVTAAIAGASDTTRAPGHAKDMMLNDCVGAADGSPARDVPGPVERTLRDLGVDSPDVLWRAADLDRASSRLIIDAAGELPPEQRRPKATVLSRSAGSAGLVNHALASGDPRAAVVLRRASPGREPAEREP